MIAATKIRNRTIRDKCPPQAKVVAEANCPYSHSPEKVVAKKATRFAVSRELTMGCEKRLPCIPGCEKGLLRPVQRESARPATAPDYRCFVSPSGKLRRRRAAVRLLRTRPVFLTRAGCFVQSKMGRGDLLRVIFPVPTPSFSGGKMRLRHQSNGVTIDVPCKVNIYLEVLAKRPDGFHEIETLMATTGVCDTLEFVPWDSSDLLFSCRWAAGCELLGRSLQRRVADADLFGPLPETEQNLAWRAVQLMRREVERETGVLRGARVTLVKRVPAAAGLGGASADAAAALVAANEAWQLRLSAERLHELAAKLGSDVPFFLPSLVRRVGKAAICRGRGERIENVPQLRRRPVVIVRPPVGLSTPKVYAGCRPTAEQAGAVNKCLAAWNGVSDQALQKSMVNRLEAPARELSPWIDTVTARLQAYGVVAQQMSGSGSSVLGVARSRRHARRAAGNLQCQGVGWAAATQCPGD